MGRPLNKKYFGNLTADGIGGEGVASITVTAGGSYSITPAVTISPPALPGGVQATVGDITMLALSATVGTSGTGDTGADYLPGDSLTVVGGTGTASVFTVDSVKIRTAAMVTDAGGFSDGDTITFSTGWDVPATLTLVVFGGNITGVGISNAGVITGALPSDPVTPDATSGGGTLVGTTFNLGFGVNAVSLDIAGEYTPIPVNPAQTTTDSVNGTGATLTVSYTVTNIPIAERGSGYIDAGDALVIFGSGTAAAYTTLSNTAPIALTPYAVTVSGGTVLPADIIKQTGESTYLMETTEGKSLCTLGTSMTPNVGGAYLLATDSNGSTYYITKLTAHLAHLYRRTMVGSYVYENEDSAPWTFDAPDNLIVQVYTT
jgi:hypothetical protein